jgi:hypothetical protein
MPKKTKFDREAAIAFFTAHGWKEDKYGHLQRVAMNADQERTYRIKLQDTSLRVERQITVMGQHEWQRINGDYYCNITIEGDAIFFGTKQVPERLLVK